MSKTNKQYNKSLYIFHRAFRLHDNLGLIKALEESETVIPVFIFTPEQVDRKKNEYFSDPSVRFMIGGLKDLDTELKSLKSKLHVFYGKNVKVLEKIFNKHSNIDAVYMNTDYTPYAKQRDINIRNKCSEFDIEVHSVEDYMLVPMGDVQTGTGDYFKVYTPYYREALTKTIANVKKNNHKNYGKITMPSDVGTTLNKMIKKINIEDGHVPDFEATREEGLKRIANIKKKNEYEDKRDTLTYKTTHLSPYIKFGLISIREVYHMVRKEFDNKHGIIAQLHWRDFYFNVAHHNPQMLEGASYRDKYDGLIKWDDNKKILDKWITGMTGYPLVDAGMRQLNTEGYMHNRARLITANFLTKICLVDWREGEKYFASKLVDYDPIVNNGNWQFVSGTGSSVQQYTRFMSPVAQFKHDPECDYIKQWIPELRDVPAKHIKNWHEEYRNYEDVDYPEPCIEYDYNGIKDNMIKAYKGTKVKMTFNLKSKKKSTSVTIKTTKGKTPKSASSKKKTKVKKKVKKTKVSKSKKNTKTTKGKTAKGKTTKGKTTSKKTKKNVKTTKAKTTKGKTTKKKK